MLEKLTNQQEQLMVEIRNKRINLLSSGKTEIDKKACEKGINRFYKIAGLKKPKIVYLYSPMGNQLAYNYLKQVSKVGDSVGDSVRASVGDSVGASVRVSVRASIRDSVRASVGDSVRASVRASVRDSVRASIRASVGDSVRASIRDSVRASIRASVGDSVRASIRDSVGDSVGASVRDSVRASIRDSVGDSVGDSVRASVGASVGASKLEYETQGFIGSLWYWNIVAFYDFFKSIQIDLGKKEKDFNIWKNLSESGLYDALCFENYCFVCSLPEFVSKDEKGRMHSISKSAIRFKDGYELYYIHGVKFDESEFKDFTEGDISGLDILKWPNQDQKRVMMMSYGNDKLIKELNMKEINLMKDDNGYDMRLLSLEDNTIDDKDKYMVFYEATDPSKDEKIVLRVPPEFKNKTAYEAKLWTFAPLREEYEKNKSLSFTKET